ncbi:MAG: hypothetical protein EU535_08515 [Promethearchaeota archaeon]|nr:MAG: hypothetical protein EU535_08515 [Candidatus Lokiarchaeota archaeon]
MVHILAMSLFMFGIVLLHAVYNSTSEYDWMYFFDIQVNKVAILDSGILCISVGFFIEFFMTFKPILIVNRRESNKKKRFKRKP